jgi:hypothetical protein
VRQGRGGGQGSGGMWREEKHEKGGLVPTGGGQRGQRGNSPVAARARGTACPHRGGAGVADAQGSSNSGRGREERGAGVPGPTHEKTKWSEPG